MVFIIYFAIGFIYWFINSFVRKLDIDDNWLLPLVWFVAWPLPILAWCAIATGLIVFEIGEWIRKQQLGKRF